MRASLDPDALIVQVGCGNSKLGVNLFEDGFRFLINIDISRAVLAQMQAMKSQAATMPDEQRRAYAEAVATRLWEAMGGDGDGDGE